MLTNQQLALVKAEINSDPALSSVPMTPDGAFAIADALNLDASPAYYVWRSSLTVEEATERTSPEATNWSWTGTGFITRSVGERDAWRELFRDGSCNPSLANVRQAFSDILSGNTAPAPANRTHLLAMAKRPARRIEKVLATGTGSLASPATMGYEGTISYTDVEAARLLP